MIFSFNLSLTKFSQLWSARLVVVAQKRLESPTRSPTLWCRHDCFATICISFANMFINAIDHVECKTHHVERKLHRGCNEIEIWSAPG